MKTVDLLFNGKIHPFESLAYIGEGITANNRLNEYLDIVDQKIPKEDREFFSDKLREQISALETNLARQCFEEGFSLGLRLAAECYIKDT